MKELEQSYKELKQKFPQIRSFTQRMIEDEDGETTPIYFAYIEDLANFDVTKFPDSINGIEIRIKQWENIQFRYDNTNVQNAKRLYNTIRRWTGSAGFVCKDAEGNHLLTTNYHVGPDIMTPITYNGQLIGEVIQTGIDKQLDISFIKLNDYGKSEFPLTSSLGYDFTSAELNETIYCDGSYGEPVMGRLVEVGYVGINDPILGKFTLFGNTIRKYNNHKVVISGDSGCPAYVNYFGKNYVTGIMNGSNGFNHSTYMSIDKIMEAFPQLVWGEVTMSDPQYQILLSELETQKAKYQSLFGYYRQMKIRLNENEVIRNDIAHKWGMFMNSLEPSARDIFQKGIDSSVK